MRAMHSDEHNIQPRPGMNILTAEGELPSGYFEFLESVKETITDAQLRVARQVNTALIELYWRIGGMIRDRQQQQGWGAKVITRLAADLRTAYPEMRGRSPCNLRHMRTFANAWPDAIVQQAAAQLPWGRIAVLLDRVRDRQARDFYAQRAVEEGWIRES